MGDIQIGQTQIQCIQGDITVQKVDAIVNAANSSLLGGGGVDGAIHRAGGSAILEECQQIRNRQGGCPTGEAVITTGGRLPAKYVIHTVGPVWNGGSNNERQLLSHCYQNSLQLADEHNVTTIAFPNISTGIYHFPKDEAAQIALDTVQDYIQQHTATTIQQITFVCYDADNLSLYQQHMQS